MKKTYADMTAEECAKYFIKKTWKSILYYALALALIVIIAIKGYIYISPLGYWDGEVYEIYVGLFNAWFIFALIMLLVCFFTILIIIAAQAQRFDGISTDLCDPEKYIEAEKNVSKHVLMGFRTKYRKCKIAGAYMLLQDYDNAWKILEKLIPDDVSKCNNRYILEVLACYFCSMKDEENTNKYLKRLEEIKASKRVSRKLLGLAIDNIKGSMAIYEKKYDEAKEYINRCMEYKYMSASSKMNCFFRLAEIAYETGDYAEAIHMHKNVISVGGEKLHYYKDAKERLEELEAKIIKD